MSIADVRAYLDESSRIAIEVVPALVLDLSKFQVRDESELTPHRRRQARMYDEARRLMPELCATMDRAVLTKMPRVTMPEWQTLVYDLHAVLSEGLRLKAADN